MKCDANSEGERMQLMLPGSIRESRWSVVIDRSE